MSIALALALASSPMAQDSYARMDETCVKSFEKVRGTQDFDRLTSCTTTTNARGETEMRATFESLPIVSVKESTITAVTSKDGSMTTTTTQVVTRPARPGLR